MEILRKCWTTAYVFTQTVSLIHKQWLLQSTLAMKYEKKKKYLLCIFCPKIVAVILFLTFLALSPDYLLNTNGLFVFKEAVEQYTIQPWSPWKWIYFNGYSFLNKESFIPTENIKPNIIQRFNRPVFIMQDTAMSICMSLYLRSNQYGIINNSTMHLLQKWKKIPDAH